MAGPIDKSGNVHDTAGRFVNLKDYTERIFAEREKQMERIFAERESSAEFKRLALKDALDKAEVQVATALTKQEATMATKLDDAKEAADEVIKGIRAEIVVLQSGGAPFANRLDTGLTNLRTEVDILNKDAVRTKVLDALAERATRDAKAQKRQILYIAIAAAISFAFSLILLLITVFF